MKSMLNYEEKLQQYLSGFEFPLVRTAYIARSRLETGRIADTRTWMLANGFELLDNVPKDCLLTDDGREILRAHGKVWALTKEEHDRRLQEAFAYQETIQEESKISPSSIQNCMIVFDDVPCGGELLVKKVCPSSDLGRRGIKRISKCSVCETVSILEATEKFSKEIKNG